MGSGSLFAERRLKLSVGQGRTRTRGLHSRHPHFIATGCFGIVVIVGVAKRLCLFKQLYRIGAELRLNFHCLHFLDDCVLV